MATRFRHDDLPAVVRAILRKPAVRTRTRADTSEAYKPSLVAFCAAAGLPTPIPEYHFAQKIGRQWRFDFAFPSRLVALEVEGLTRDGGRHQRREGYGDDCEKYAEALCTGWRVLRVTTGQFKSGEAFGWLERLLGAMT